MNQLVPLIPETAPFTSEQRAWLNGFFAGLFSRGEAAAGSNPSSQISNTAPSLTPLTILFGSQTGSAEGLAKRTAKEAARRSFAPTIIDMGQMDLTRLGVEKNVLVITSTYGDGEPPDNAAALHSALSASAQLSPLNPQLSTLRYSVCALGDTNYSQFCKCGQDFDAFFEKLGATRVSPRIDCDLEFEEKFTAWLDTALTALANQSSPTGPSTAPRSRTTSPTEVAETPTATSPASVYSRANPFPALLRTSSNLNAAGSAKQVHHVEFDLEQSGLVYEAGDALGVIPQNCPKLVAEILLALACDGEEAVPAPDGTTTSLRRALTELYDSGKPSPDLLAAFGPTGGGGTVTSLLHVVDVLAARVDIKLTPAAFIGTLKKLQPRLYSISSSPKAHAGQVHLTVGALRYEFDGRPRQGVCSTFLLDRAVPGTSRIGVFVHSNKAFRPPANGDTPMIMIGPGTGIAPFRAFLHERQAQGARGQNWLFFGDQCAATDFLYREELATLTRDGVLTRLDTAFSRDQREKIYVQHRMLENAGELFAWLEAGAHLYVCGDASRMAKDVDAALHTVIERAGARTADQAAAYVQALKTARRYARDVY